jgi:type VI secretion system secreted protein VgrG
METLRPLAVELQSAEFETRDVQIFALRGLERISQPFWFEIELVLRNALPLPDGAVPGAAVSLVFSRDGDEPFVRHVHGIIESVRDRLDALLEHRTYVLRIVPELSRLRLVETQEIFLGATVPEIISQKLGLHELSGERLRMNAEGYPAREFVVQYRESDLAFVSRLAEHLGISYVFEHGETGRECVIFTDDVASTGLAASVAEIPYHAGGERLGVYSLEVERRMMPTTYFVQDYNYRTPLAEISGQHQLASDGAPLGNGGGIIEYGTHHKDKDQGDALARVRAEERLSGHEVYAGKSAIPALTAGLKTKLTGHPLIGEPDLLIVEVEHTARFASDKGPPASYENSFRAISSTVRYRPPRVTPRPRIHGLVTGTVALGAAGTVGGLAQIDDEGRYVVHLHFDTVAHEGEEKASHPIRMAQPFAGPNHGMHFPLRPGSEVVIAFMDGDPDRPIIVGSVPNAIARSTTTSANSNKNRIASAAGVLIEFGEGK